MANFGVLVNTNVVATMSTGGNRIYFVGGAFPGGTITELNVYAADRAGVPAFNDFDMAIYAGGDASGPAGATLVWESKRYAAVAIGAVGWKSIVDASDAVPNEVVSAQDVWVMLRSNDGIDLRQVDGADRGDFAAFGDTESYVITGSGDNPGDAWPSTFPANGASYSETMKVYLVFTEAAPPDETPDSFSLTDQQNVPLGSLRTSNTITIAGVDPGTDVSIVGGEFSKNGGIYTSAPTTVSDGDELTVRHTASSSPRTTVTSTLTVGTFSESFSSTTGHFRQAKSGTTDLTDDLDLALTLDAQALPNSVLYWDVVTAKNDNTDPGVFGDVSSPGWDVIESVDSGTSGYTKLTRLRRVVKADSLNGSNVASEPTTYTVTSDFTGEMYRINGGIVELVGVDTVIPEDAPTVPTFNTSASQNATAPTLSPVSNATLRLDAFAAGDGNTQLDVSEGMTPPGSMVERTEIIENNRYLILAQADEVITGTTSTGTRTATFPSTSHKSLVISTLVRAAGSTPLGTLLLLGDFGANPGFAIRI